MLHLIPSFKADRFFHVQHHVTQSCSTPVLDEAFSGWYYTWRTTDRTDTFQIGPFASRESANASLRLLIHAPGN